MACFRASRSNVRDSLNLLTMSLLTDPCLWELHRHQSLGSVLLSPTSASLSSPLCLPAVLGFPFASCIPCLRRGSQRLGGHVGFSRGVPDCRQCLHSLLECSEKLPSSPWRGILGPVRVAILVHLFITHSSLWNSPN